MPYDLRKRSDICILLGALAGDCAHETVRPAWWRPQVTNKRADGGRREGGDCAERFDECASAPIAARLKILLQMSLVLAHGGRRRVIRVGRFAGQYAKPRSTSTESRDGVELPSYRGDNINASAFGASERAPDPARLVEGHSRSALTLNFIRSLIDGGFADLHHPEYWDLDFASHSPRGGEYQAMVEATMPTMTRPGPKGGWPVLVPVDFL